MTNTNLSPRSVLNIPFNVRDGTVSDSEIVYTTRNNTSLKAETEGQQEKVRVGAMKKPKRKTLKKYKRIDFTEHGEKVDDDDWEPLGSSNAMYEFIKIMFGGIDLGEDEDEQNEGQAHEEDN